MPLKFFICIPQKTTCFQHSTGSSNPITMTVLILEGDMVKLQPELWLHLNLHSQDVSDTYTASRMFCSVKFGVDK